MYDLYKKSDFLIINIKYYNNYNNYYNNGT